MPRPKPAKAPRCTGRTRAGTRCRLTVVPGHSRCYLHLDYAGDLVEALAKLALGGGGTGPATPAPTPMPPPTPRPDLAPWAYYHALKPALQGLPTVTPLAGPELKAYTDTLFATLAPEEKQLWAEHAARLVPSVTL